jgi:hypothetical protein
MLFELKFLILINGCDCNNNIYLAKKRKQTQPKSLRLHEFFNVFSVNIEESCEI